MRQVNRAGKWKLLIRVDANGEIGTGHLMRCLAIAEEYRAGGGEAVFLIADASCADILERRDFPYRCLHSAWNDLEGETELLIGAVEEEGTPLLLVDSYFVTRHYLSALREHAIVAYMDDLDRFVYPVDLLINYNLYARQLDYPRRYRGAGMDTRFALGCGYAPLRQEFRGVGREVPERVRRVLVTTGGADAYDVTEHLLAAFCERPWFRQLEYEVIVGKFNPHGPGLEGRWARHGNIHFRYDVEDMAAYMTSCDLAVTAGGSTVYELMACGTPAVAYSLADNQLGIVRAASEMGLIPWAGDVRDDISACCRSAASEIEKCIQEPEIMRKRSRRMREMVDGKGCARIVAMLDSIRTPKFHTDDVSSV